MSSRPLTKNQKVAIGVGVAAVGGAVVYILTRPKAGAVTGITSLNLAADTTLGYAPLTVTFAGSASGSNISGRPIYFFINGQRQSTITMTTPTGTFSFQYTFTAPGTYTVFVSDNQQGV